MMQKKAWQLQGDCSQVLLQTQPEIYSQVEINGEMAIFYLTSCILEKWDGELEGRGGGTLGKSLMTNRNDCDKFDIFGRMSLTKSM